MASHCNNGDTPLECRFGCCTKQGVYANGTKSVVGTEWVCCREPLDFVEGEAATDHDYNTIWWLIVTVVILGIVIILMIILLLIIINREFLCCCCVSKEQHSQSQPNPVAPVVIYGPSDGHGGVNSPYVGGPQGQYGANYYPQRTPNRSYHNDPSLYPSDQAQISRDPSRERYPANYHYGDESPRPMRYARDDEDREQPPPPPPMQNQMPITPVASVGDGWSKQLQLSPQPPPQPPPPPPLQQSPPRPLQPQPQPQPQQPPAPPPQQPQPQPQQPQTQQQQQPAQTPTPEQQQAYNMAYWTYYFNTINAQQQLQHQQQHEAEYPQLQYYQ